jgi:hypothetical protein
MSASSGFSLVVAGEIFFTDDLLRGPVLSRIVPSVAIVPVTP